MDHFCYDPNLELATKAKFAKVQGKSEAQESHFLFLGCEGMNPHTPKWVPTLGVGVPMESQIFIE